MIRWPISGSEYLQKYVAATRYKQGDPVHVGTKYSSSTANPPGDHRDTGTSSTDTGTGTGTATETSNDRVDATERNLMPEFMTEEMRATISHTRLTDDNLARIRKYLQDSETACDDQHQFNPSEFDMENCMRINLKPDYEAPPPEFRKQGP